MARWITGFLFPLLALHCLLAEASHFRGGIIQWAPTDSDDNTVRFMFRLGFRRSAVNCDQSTIANGTQIGYAHSWNARCSNSANLLCWYSSAMAYTYFYCTDYSVVEDWTMGENTFNYTFNATEEEWLVSYSSCCWISLSWYSGSSSWLVTTTVNLTRRSDNGKINSSPISRSAAILRFQEGCPKSVRIPVEDPDGDVVKCRFASYSESYKYSNSFPYGVLDETSCVLTYGGINGTTGTYAVALTLEDFPVGTTNLSSVRPFSAVGLQFLVIITSQSGSCNDIPVFTDSTPQDGECSEVQIGSAYRAVIEVQVADFSKHIAEIITSSATGMQLTSLRYHGGIYYRNVTWYPNQNQVGQQVFCFWAVDSKGSESERRCITILVGFSNTPRVIIESRMPRNPISKSGPGFVRWSIQFDRLIKKPRTSSYTRLVLLPSGHTVYKVDTLSQNVTIDSNRTTLHFEMPNAALSMNGSYAILVDKGAVVGQGCSYDGPPTPGITSLSDWYFNVDGVCHSGYYLAPPEFTRCVDINECGAHPGFNWSSSAQLEFELHVPSDCDQTCNNTPGSYICSCVSGNRLDSDGKTCIDINECASNNGGCSHHCFNIPGSFYCGCPEGITMASNNLTCVDASTSITCSENNMTVALEKRTFKFFQVSQLHLRYASCKATQNSTHLLISTPLNGCGTLRNETEDALIFWNEISADAVIIDYVITRTHDIKLPFYCSFSRKTLLSLSFTPQRIFFGTEVGYGNFTFKMDFFKSSSFSTPYTDQDYPLQVELNDYVYVEFSVESSADLVIMAETCKATKYGSFYSWPQYTIIQNGCPRDTTLDYSYDPTRSFQQFKIKTFRFFNNYDTVYFHCELLACHRYSPSSRCSTGCSAGSKRKRREVTRDEIEHDESTTKKILTGGPLVIKEKKESADPGDPGKSKQAALIGGAAAAGGFGLIAVAALAVLFVKYRIARRLMNRNKVGDLYTTQDEQLSRRNAYIQEDDMIEKDDDAM